MGMKNKPGSPCLCRCSGGCDGACDTVITNPWVVDPPGYAAYLADIDLSGTTTSNTTNGVLWFSVLLNPAPGVAVDVSLWNDSGMSDPTDRVARYTSPIGVAGTIALAEENSSGITGTLTFSAPPSDISGTLDGFWPCKLVVDGQRVISINRTIESIPDPFVFHYQREYGGTHYNHVLTIYGLSQFEGEYPWTIGDYECGDCVGTYEELQSPPGYGSFTDTSDNPFYTSRSGTVYFLFTVENSGGGFLADDTAGPLRWRVDYEFECVPDGGDPFFCFGDWQLKFFFQWYPSPCYGLPTTEFTEWYTQDTFATNLIPQDTWTGNTELVFDTP